MDYPPEELEACLQRAIVDRGMRVLIIESRRSPFLIAAGNHGARQGWLSDMEIIQDDSQSSHGEYRVLPAGLAHFGVS